MNSIFEPLERSWAQLHDSLHVYALPRLATELITPYQEAIERSGVCAVQPEGFLHATVTRLPGHRNTVAADQLASYRAALDRTAAIARPFTVALGRPAVRNTAVAAAGESTAQWQTLVHDVRQAAAACFPGQPLPAPPFAPHVSLGYGTHPAADAPLVRELEMLAESTRWQAELVVDAIHLLAVHANPSPGTFTWDVVSVHPFGGATAPRRRTHLRGRQVIPGGR